MRTEGGRRAPVVVALVALLATLALVPFARHPLGPSIAFVPAMLAVVACFDVISVYLLVGDYLDNGDRRLLAMSWAYLWSLVLMTGYAFAFPGVVTGAPFAVTPSVAPAMYIGWHAGFPVLLGAAWAPWPGRNPGTTRAGRRRRTALLSSLAVVAAAAAAVTAVVRDAHALPTLIVGLDTHRMAQLTAPVVIPLVLVSLVSAFHGLRGRRGPERWTTVAVLVCLCDLVLTYSARYRYTLGWYAGRGLTLTGAMLVAVAVLASFRRLKAASERQAGTDGLTGAANRRTMEAALQAQLARADRVQGWTSVLLLDLDGFKALNDRAGHAAGDAVLVACVAAWTKALRAGDLLARVGGDEFIVMVCDADPRSAQVVADRLRGCTPVEVGVSIGVATVRGDHDVPGLVAAADRAMYAMKVAHHSPGRGTDTLTGLPDRGTLEVLLQSSLDDRAPTAVLAVELEGVALVTESLGHVAGDDLLRQVALRLATRLTMRDVLGRLGGDGFAVLRAESSGAEALAQRLVDAAREPFVVEGREVFVRASVGVASAPDQASDGAQERTCAEHLLRDAGTAASRAAERGGSRVEVYVRLQRELALARLELGSDLCRAVDRSGLADAVERLGGQPVLEPTVPSPRAPVPAPAGAGSA